MSSFAHPHTKISASQFLMMGPRPTAPILVEEERKMKGCFCLLACSFAYLLPCLLVLELVQRQVVARDSVSGWVVDFPSPPWVEHPCAPFPPSFSLLLPAQFIKPQRMLLYLWKGQGLALPFPSSKLKTTSYCHCSSDHNTEDPAILLPPNQGKISVPLLKSEYFLLYSPYIWVYVHLYTYLCIYYLCFSP